jgi:Domain of unknown function (DUF2017)
VDAGPRISRAPDGVRLDLPEDERALLSQVAGELRTLIDDVPEDPSLRRLFPRAHEDEALEEQYRELTRDQLTTGRDRALETIEETASNTLLSPKEADAWLRGLNDARLVLGTRLEVTEDFDWDAVDLSHPHAQELALYAYLSWLQEQLVEALA